MPLKHGKCSNCTSSILTSNKLISSELEVENEEKLSDSAQFSFADQKMIEAFGAPLSNSFGPPLHSQLEKIWERSTWLRGKTYRVPGGAVGRYFTAMLARETLALANADQKSEKVCIFGKLILQKDKKINKSADIRRLIRRRMGMWEKGLYEELMQEAELCDKKLGRSMGSNTSEEQTVKVFSRLILLGKIREAARFITDRGSKGGILNPHDVLGDGKTVKQVLESKHPSQGEANPDAFLVCEKLPALVEIDVSAEHVLKVSRTLSGSAGLSALDSAQWTDLLLKYGGASADLREAVAALVRRLANENVPWIDTRALRARKLIALDKCPGVRPIGVGDVLDRLCAKVMIEVTGDDVQHACLADQICSGLKSGIEASIHAFSEIFNVEAQNGYGLLLIDADNAFNTISRPAALWNARVLWPRCSKYLFNAYKGYSLLVISGSKVCLLSKEGVTQGDPLAMLLYGLAVLPLARTLKKPGSWTQNWYADDSACLARFELLREWLALLMIEGPKYGYFPKPEKSVIVVHPNYLHDAAIIFDDLGIKVVTGHRFLGGFIGSEVDSKDWLGSKVDSWVDAVVKLSSAAILEPQAAYVALSKSVQNEWLFIQRVLSSSQDAFEALSRVIKTKFLPNLFGITLTDLDISLLCRPSRHLGIGILDPVLSARNQYAVSKIATSELAKCIQSGSSLSLNMHEASISNGRIEKGQQETTLKQETLAMIECFQSDQKRCLLRKIDQKCSGWLSIVPSKDNHFDLSPDEFRDALALRYGKTPANLPKICDADGATFDVNHALNCPKGGLVYGRHNECRDLNCDLLRLAGLKQIVSEPILRESDVNGENGLRADWGVRGFWQPQRQAVFDVCILNADSSSISHLSTEAIFESRRTLKKRTYSEIAETRRASFTPFIATCDAILDREAEGYLKRLAILLSEKWDCPYSRMIGWVRARIQICILRSASLCFRGSRSKLRGAGIEDSAATLKMDLE